MLNLATRGVDYGNRLKILRRHLMALARHCTLKKICNLITTEVNLLLKRECINSFPYILKVESTNLCNLKCRYCYDGRRAPQDGERPYGRMSLDTFKRLVDELEPYIFKINLYGFGEPFLFPETMDMIRYATDRNVGVGVSSNLNIPDNSLAERIVESGLEVLIFSCHGATSASFGKFTGGGDMALSLDNVRKIREYRDRARSRTPLIDWQFCLTRFNCNERDMAVAMSKDLGVDQIRFIQPFLPADADAEWCAEENVRALEPPLAHKPDCCWPYRSAYISWDGGVSPCCADVRRISADFGNIRQDAFTTIWRGDAYRTARRLIANPCDKAVPKAFICDVCPVIVTARRNNRLNLSKIDG